MPPRLRTYFPTRTYALFADFILIKMSSREAFSSVLKLQRLSLQFTVSKLFSILGGITRQHTYLMSRRFSVLRQQSQYFTSLRKKIHSIRELPSSRALGSQSIIRNPPFPLRTADVVSGLGNVCCFRANTFSGLDFIAKFASSKSLGIFCCVLTLMPLTRRSYK
jgi:hypothetical protein